tara:strand:+ start:821 stop:1138 length:318 start_codon:yes stop_codon:yes gene_type:complete
MNKFRIYWDIASPTLGILLISAIMFFVIGMVLSIPLCLLWNWLMPFIFGLPKLNLLQTFGLSILISLLAPRKIDLGKKEKPNKIDEDLNNNLEDLLKDLSSQFRA